MVGFFTCDDSRRALSTFGWVFRPAGGCGGVVEGGGDARRSNPTAGGLGKVGGCLEVGFGAVNLIFGFGSVWDFWISSGL